MASSGATVIDETPGGGIMTPTHVDQLTETPPLEPEIVTLPPAPSAPRRSRGPSAWAPMFEMRERRWWTVALAATLLISAGGVGLLYLDDTGNQATIRSLTTENEQLRGHSQILQDQLRTTEQNLNSTMGELERTKAELEHPTVTIWNVPQEIKGANAWLEGNVPDTFTYHLHVTSTGPMSVSILTLQNYAAANVCMDQGGTANYCMHHSGSAIGWLNKTSVDYDFHLAEGCADYVAVFTSPTTITLRPNVSVTYQPASSATGTCVA